MHELLDEFKDVTFYLWVGGWDGAESKFLTHINHAYLNFSEDGQYFLKVLIPSYAAGSIIGKGGQTIVQLQKETGATIKLSKSKDFYPGTCKN